MRKVADLCSSFENFILLKFCSVKLNRKQQCQYAVVSDNVQKMGYITIFFEIFSLNIVENSVNILDSLDCMLDQYSKNSV